jgi:hypothetical protein
MNEPKLRPLKKQTTYLANNQNYNVVVSANGWSWMDLRDMLTNSTHESYKIRLKGPTLKNKRKS